MPPRPLPLMLWLLSLLVLFGLGAGLTSPPLSDTSKTALIPWGGATLVGVDASTVTNGTNPTAAGSYVVATHMLLAGETVNTMAIASLDACAEACDANANCTWFNYCEAQVSAARPPACPAGALGWLKWLLAGDNRSWA